MTRISGILRVPFAVLLLGTLSVGCQSLAAKKTPAMPKDPPMPAPAPPSWETGCQTLYTPPVASNGTLAPKMELTWAILSDQTKTMGGPAQVGPDGTVVIGPYGQFKVAGLTLTQATHVIEEGIRKYPPNTPNTHVQLQLAGSTYPTSMNPGPGAVAMTPMPANTVGPDWGASNSPAALPPGAVGPNWGSAPTAMPTSTTMPSSAITPQNKRGPVMTYVFGPRY